MGNWTHVNLEVITSDKLPENFFGKELHDADLPWNMPYEEKCKVHEMEQAAWDYAFAHEDEFLPIGEGRTLSYVKDGVYYPYKLLGEPKLGYRTVIAGSINEYVEENIVEWFKRKCETIPCEVLFINAKAEGLVTVKYTVNEDFVRPLTDCFDEDGDLDENKIPPSVNLGNMHDRRKRLNAERRTMKLKLRRNRYKG